MPYHVLKTRNSEYNPLSSDRQHLSYDVSGGARTSRQPGHFQVTKVVRQVIGCKGQRSKAARSIRSQKKLEPGHHWALGVHFFLKKVDDIF